MKKRRESDIRALCTRYGFEVLELRQQRHILVRLAKAGQEFRAVFAATPSNDRSDRNALSRKNLYAS